MITSSGSDNMQEGIRLGHERARQLLKQSHADVMIWGTVLDANKVDSPLSLHWAKANDVGAKTTSESYRPKESNYDLPELFWNDLSDVLGLLATSQAAPVYEQQGQFVADQLKPFIVRVRALLASNKLAADKRPAIQLPFADALTTYGQQRGDSHALVEAVAAYRDALQERTRKRVPLDWAMTQNNLGTALSTLGERESGTARLNEAVAAYRDALQERTRKRVPLQWAMTQNGSVAKFDFSRKTEFLIAIDSMTYRIPHSSKTNFATEPSGMGSIKSGAS